mmetsp:Transcript_12140/g.39921  ORF Transcript_12140/g.39921 Transcript_12140/m.39921 type:complete len:267 (+) Transcript_12140:696-1496(+)
MSVRMTSTCLPHSYARYSAVVSAMRGVMMRSMVGSLARLRKSVTRSIDPFSSKSRLKKLAVSIFTPIAANTMANSSESSSSASPSKSTLLAPSAEVDGFFTSPACRQICAAISLCGRPAALKSGIFCPRAIEFITSMEEMPVWIMSCGYVRSEGLMEAPEISRYFSASTGGPPSIGFPDPLKTRPSISCATGVIITSPVNSNDVSLLSIPAVPSNTCTTARDPSTSSTCPRRTLPSPSLKFTISAYLGSCTLSRMTSGPATPETVR